MKNFRKSEITKVLFIICISFFGMSSNTGNAQGNMLNPVEIMSPLVFSVQRLENGHTMYSACYSVSDVEIIEVDEFGHKVWSYSEGLAWVHSANWCEKTKTVLIADTNNNRVFEVNRNKEIVWQFDDEIKYPNDADRLENGNTLITVRDSDKIIEVTPEKEVVWEYQGVKGPHNADRLKNGNTIIANSMDNKVIEVDKKGNIVWQYSGELFWPRDADRLENGNTLIADSRHQRVLEIDTTGKIIWEVNNLPSVYDVDRLSNGNTLISADLKPGQVIEVDKNKRIVWRSIASDSGKLNGFQYHPSTTTSYLRTRITELIAFAEKIRIPLREFSKVKQLLDLSRKALFNRQYELNKKLVYDCVSLLEELINKYQKCEKGIVSGVVVDSKTNKPVVNAKVFLFGTIYLTETDKNGKFKLTHIPRINSGFTLIIDKPGYFELQVDNVEPISPITELKDKTYTLDAIAENTKYRAEVLTFKFAVLREHVKKDEFQVGSKKLLIPTEYPEEVCKYLALESKNSHEVTFVNNLATKVEKLYANAKEKRADMIVLSALETLYQADKIEIANVKVFDEIASVDWQRYNGRFGKNFNTSINTNSNAKTNGYLDSHSLIRIYVNLLRKLHIPARVAWIQSHPVVQWWANTPAEGGRWLNTEIILLFEDKNPESWSAETLHNVKSEEITLICKNSDCNTYLDWNFPPSGLWVQNKDNQAFFMHNETGLKSAKFALQNFEKRGFVAGQLDNLTTMDEISVLSYANKNYEVFDLGVNLSLANMKEKREIKFYVQMSVDSEFTKILDTKFFCNHKNWIKSIETETKQIPNTNESIKIKCITIEPK